MLYIMNWIMLDHHRLNLIDDLFWSDMKHVIQNRLFAIPKSSVDHRWSWIAMKMANLRHFWLGLGDIPHMEVSIVMGVAQMDGLQSKILFLWMISAGSHISGHLHLPMRLVHPLQQRVTASFFCPHSFESSRHHDELGNGQDQLSSLWPMDPAVVWEILGVYDLGLVKKL